MQYSIFFIQLVVLGILLCSSSLAELVLTPGGYMPEECVHEVPNGATLLERGGDTLEVITLEGEQLSFPVCRGRGGIKDSGWNTYVTSEGVDFSSFSCEWKVPAEPIEYNDQTLYFFSSFMDILQNEIIQPVIQYGPSPAGGGPFWGIASWWVNSTDNALYSPLITIDTGNQILGTISINAQSNWIITGVVNETLTTTLKVVPQAAQQLATFTMEVYNADGCGEYPDDSGISFYNYNLIDSGQPYTPTWRQSVDFTDCKEGVHISPDNVTLTYSGHV